ncbi:SixA phosphatase family protein [Ferruginibacter sp.]|nr:histidine phosphatase family protein [Ferruginibacter sp.]
MKTLLIIRHAKAESSFTLNDFERPLNERGKKDAPVMAQRLLDKKIVIDAFVSSPAKRAKKTAELFYETYKAHDDIILISALYHAPAEIFFDVIKEVDDKFDTIAVFAHNPGITYFVNQLTAVRIDNVPTCAVFAVTINCNSWKDFAKAKKEFLFFDYPKLV